ncbi:HIT family protein [Sphingosinicella soli]|uniref:Diadenosine tetraphosphate (Ap4A) HIT family hydrolase n=1 Tax=Sphingosinicella soli TaxID=333708 RepID=A0A7W7F7Z4_9SPHN|nr:HIT family protein [Sphingosinicella soli]MBB4633142.1 diadenosine tetraphosphate (Ap4A) HIT family hydrolase [Sphingosinicella soli]
MNETIIRFGYPATLIAEYEHWLVLLRPAQPTLASLVLAAKSDATAFADLPPPAYAELAQVSRDIESALRSAVDHARLNYMMLMMVDPHVHSHVIPRYEGSRSFEGREFPDAGWPKLPALGEAVELDAPGIAAVSGWLKGLWPPR